MFFMLWMDYYPYLHFHEDGKNLCEGHCNVLEVMFKFYLFNFLISSSSLRLI